jgi:N-acetylglutamate synthase-like GNAT family acetyltransferase
VKWLKSILGSRYPWEQEAVRKRLRPFSFRVATREDFPTCEKLYEDNERHGLLPQNVRQNYSQELSNGAMLVFMVEQHQRVVATCAINRVHDRLAWLCYGLVTPELHRTGIGTTMFLARLSLLAPDGPDQTLAISALETSLPFYRQFGFRLIGRFDGSDGNRYPIAVLENIHSGMIQSCRSLLKDAGTIVPDVADQIPYTQTHIPSGVLPV